MGITGWTRGLGLVGADWALGGVLFDSRTCGFGFGADRRSIVFWMSARLRRNDVSALLDRLLEEREETGTVQVDRQEN